MATLNSPGVSVTVTSEDFYTSTAPGTVPLIIVASQANKQNSAGTGIAPGTIPANAGTVYLLTSQYDVGTYFGNPYFQTDANNNPINAGELNEYGLMAAYSFLGVSNRAYVVRANIDTSQLIGTPTIPTGSPTSGTIWFNTAATAFGIFEWNGNVATATNGQTFVEQQSINNLLVITSTSQVNVSTYAPLPSVGQQGNYAVVALTTLNRLWYKKPLTATPAGTWVQVGTPAWIASRATATGTTANPSSLVAGTAVTFLGYTPNGSTTLTVTGTPSSTIIIGSTVSVQTGIQAGTTIVAQVSGTTGGVGVYTLSLATTQAVGTSGTPVSYTVTPTADTFVINGTSVSGFSSLTTLVTAITTANPTGVTAAAINGFLNLYSNGTTTNGANPVGSITLSGTAVAKVGLASVTYQCPQFTAAPHTSIPSYAYTAGITTNGAPTGSVWLKTTSVNLGSNWVISQYNSTTASWVVQNSPLYASNYAAMATLDPVGGGINIPLNTLYVKYNDDEQSPQYADWKIYYRAVVGPTSIVSTAVTATTLPAASYTFTVTASQKGSSTLTGTVFNVSFTSTGATSDAATFLTAFQAAVTDPLISSSLNTTTNVITITHVAGGDLQFVDGTGTPIVKLFTPGTTANFNYTAPKLDAIAGASSTTYIASNWSSTVGTSGLGIATPSATAPTTTPANGRYWYNSSISNFDILINDGQLWRGFQTTQAKALNSSVYASGSQAYTDPNGPIVSATAPLTQAAGTALANGDIWINTSTLSAFPQIYKYNSITATWVLVNNTDHTTGNGIVFADARWSDQSALSTVQTGLGAPDTIVSLLSSSFVDFDCPSPALYPKGTLLFNTRRSDYNVKQYVTGYVNTLNYNTQYTLGGTYPVGTGQQMTYYYPDRWITAAANTSTGVGQFGSAAQRQVVVTALQATINSNQNIRQTDSIIYNLLACPGYIETFSSLVSLNTGNGQSAFIVMDAPAKLLPTATSMNAWGTNSAGASSDSLTGLVTTDTYSAVYYPWGQTQDLGGNNIVVPPSHVMLRTIALNDNVAYPWFAPAGVRRGGVTNVSSVGYVDPNLGTYITVALNQGQRDTMAGVQVNPITYLGGTGLVVYGQYTRQLVASSTNRINVARLVIYLRYQLNVIAKPFIFEPNDQITRNQIKQQIENLMLSLVAQRGLYDYLVVCDKSNNTLARIANNQLQVDIAIIPTKAVEFIYIPLRLENPGTPLSQLNIG